MNIDMTLFLSFLRMQPKNQKYIYADNFDCPIAKFLKSIGCEKVLVSTWNFNAKFDGVEYKCSKIPQSLRFLLIEYPRTYGELYNRVLASTLKDNS